MMSLMNWSTAGHSMYRRNKFSGFTVSKMFHCTSDALMSTQLLVLEIVSSIGKIEYEKFESVELSVVTR